MTHSPERPGLHVPLASALIVLAAFAPTPDLSIAQEKRPAETTYSGAFVGVPLADALSRIVKDTRISIAFESALVTGPVSHCKAVDLAMDDLMTCVLADTGLDFIRLSSGTYVIVRQARATARTGSLIGRVVDSETLSPLADANVILEGANVGASTNADGRFALAGLTAGTHRIAVTHVAYQNLAYDVTVNPDERTNVDLQLAPRIVTSAPIVINGFERRLPMTRLEAATPLPGSELLAEVGTRDLIQNLGSVAGVHLESGMSDVHIQGGDSGEQQFRLDGMPIYLPIANAGYFGPFSPDAIGHVTVRKAGFGAVHGSGLSGVVDLTHRLAPARNYTGSVSIDAMSTSMRVGGSHTLGRNIRATWMLGGRKSLWDVLGSPRLERLFASWGTADPFLSEALGVTPAGAVVPPSNSGNVELDFHSLHGATRIQFGGFRTLSASFFRGGNLFGLEGVALSNGDSTFTFTDRYEWLNRAVQVRYEWVATGRVLLSASAWNSKYELSRPTLSSFRDSLFIEDFNEINQWGFRFDWQYSPAQRHLLSGNTELSHTGSNFSFSIDPLGETVAAARDIQPVKTVIAGHIEDRISITSASTLTIGSRFTFVPDHGELLAEPRVEYRHDLSVRSGTASTRIAAGQYRQFLNSFDVTTSGIATLLPVLRYWLPVGREQPSPVAYHIAAGVIYQPDPKWELGLETFYKKQNKLLVPDYGRDSANDPVLIEARGYVYGGSASVARDAKFIRAEARYEYESVRRRVRDRFGGDYTTVPWESPHRLLFAIHATPGKGISAFARWNSWFGRSWAFRQSYYDYLEPDPTTRNFGSVNLSEPYRHRLPDYSQLDVGAGIHFVLSGLSFDARVHLTNLLGRNNTNDFSLVRNGDSFGREARQSTPFLPSFSVSVSW